MSHTLPTGLTLEGGQTSPLPSQAPPPPRPPPLSLAGPAPFWQATPPHALLRRALDLGYLTQDMIDDYEPALMFTIPRLAIVW